MAETCKKKPRKSKIELRICNDLEDSTNSHGETQSTSQEDALKMLPKLKSALDDRNDNYADEASTASRVEFSVQVEVENCVDEISQDREIELAETYDDLPAEDFLPRTEVIISNDAVLQEVEKCYYSKNYSDKKLAIGVRNNWGRYAVTTDVLDYHETLIQAVLQDWKLWAAQSKLRSQILAYKCSICSVGYWHLEPFKEHIKIHSEVQLSIQSFHHEVCIVAAQGQWFENMCLCKIEGPCPKCLSSFEEHTTRKKGTMYYHCEGCNMAFSTCWNLFTHEGKCARFSNLVYKNAVFTDAMWHCNICDIKCVTETRYQSHVTLYHTVRSDLPFNFPTLKTCVACKQVYYLHNLHDCPRKMDNIKCNYCKRRFRTRVLEKMHQQFTKNDCYCKICKRYLKKQCMETEHLLKHSKNFVLVYKCMECMDNVLLAEQRLMFKHLAEWHLRLDKRRGCFDTQIVPRSCMSLHWAEGVTVQDMIITSGANKTQTNALEDDSKAKPDSLPEIIKRKKEEVVEYQKHKEEINKICVGLRDKMLKRAKIEPVDDNEVAEGNEVESEIKHEVDDVIFEEIDVYDDDAINEMQNSVDALFNQYQVKEEIDIEEHWSHLDDSQNTQTDTPKCSKEEVAQDKYQQNEDIAIIKKEPGLIPQNDDDVIEIVDDTDENAIEVNKNIDMAIIKKEPELIPQNDDNVVGIVDDTDEIASAVNGILAINENIDMAIIKKEPELIPQNYDDVVEIVDEEDEIASAVNEIVAVNERIDMAILKKEPQLIPQNDDDVIEIVDDTDEIASAVTEIVAVNKYIDMAIVKKEPELIPQNNDAIDVKKEIAFAINKIVKQNDKINITSTVVKTEPGFEPQNDDDVVEIIDENYINEIEISDEEDENVMVNDEKIDEENENLADKKQQNVESDIENEIQNEHDACLKEISKVFNVSKDTKSIELTGIRLVEDVSIKEEPIDEDFEDDIITLHFGKTPAFDVTVAAENVKSESDKLSSEMSKEFGSDFDMAQLEPEIDINQPSSDKSEADNDKNIQAPKSSTRKKSKNIYRCKKCNFYGLHREFRRHKMKCRVPKSKLKPRTNELKSVWTHVTCTKCDTVFRNLTSYCFHFTEHHNQKPRVCPVCFKEFPKKDKTLCGSHLLCHIKKTFRKIQLLNTTAYITSKTSGLYQCKMCSEKVRIDNFFKHWEAHFRLPREDDDNEEEKTVDDQNDSAVVVLPGQIMTVIEQLLQPGEKNECIVCERKFQRRNDRKRHLIEHLLRDASSRRPAICCQICHEQFKRAGQYRNHMRNHAALPMFWCEICDKHFSDSSNFAKHKKLHNLNVMQCDICKKKFHSRAQIEKHMEMHRTTEPIKCAPCDRLFYTQSSYNKHVRTAHQKFKLNRRCNMCHARFSSLKSLWDHMWEVHQERATKADCPLCNESFRKYPDVRSHLLTVHNTTMSYLKKASKIRPGGEEKIVRRSCTEGVTVEDADKIQGKVTRKRRRKRTLAIPEEGNTTANPESSPEVIKRKKEDLEEHHKNEQKTAKLSDMKLKQAKIELVDIKASIHENKLKSETKHEVELIADIKEEIDEDHIADDDDAENEIQNSFDALINQLQVKQETNIDENWDHADDSQNTESDTVDGSQEELSQNSDEDVDLIIIKKESELVPQNKTEGGDKTSKTEIGSDIDKSKFEPKASIQQKSDADSDKDIEAPSELAKIYRCKKCRFCGIHSAYKMHKAQCSKSKHKPNSYEVKSFWRYVPCTKCNTFYKDLPSYFLHFSTRHNLKPRACPVCFKECSKDTILCGTHLSCHIKKMFRKIQLINTTSYITSKTSGLYQCKVCSEKVRIDNFFKHWETHLKLPEQGDGDDDLVIDEEKSVDDQNDIAVVELSDQIKKVIDQMLQPEERMKSMKKCVMCERKFQRRNDCKRHLIEHLLRDASSRPPGLGCQVCRETFVKPDQYRNHMRNHAALPMFWCEICNKHFSDSSNFGKHKKVHNLNVFSVCDICNKKFYSKINLERHMEMHRTTDPIQCPRCKIMFFSPSHYKRHVKYAHERPILVKYCNTCHAKFNSHKAMWEHMWEVHKERRTKADCPLCNKSFRKYQDVKTHLRTAHNSSVSTVTKASNNRNDASKILEISKFNFKIDRVKDTLVIL